MTKILWEADAMTKENSRLQDFMQWLERDQNLHFDDYTALWLWSTTEIEAFWKAIARYFDIQFYEPFTSVLEGERMPEFSWFEGSTLNYAAHLLRNKKDDAIALYHAHETGDPRPMTWKEVKEKVASFRKSIAWTADSKHILFSATGSEDGDELCRISAESGEVERLGLKMDGYHSLSAHPDGRRIVFAAGRNMGEVWVMENFLLEAAVAGK